MRDISNNLISSCKKLHDRNILSQDGYKRCLKSLSNQKWLNVDSNKMENNVYGKQVAENNRKYSLKLKNYKDNFDRTCRDLNTLLYKNLFTYNNSDFNRFKKNYNDKLLEYERNIKTDIQKLNDNIYKKYGDEQYKELVSKYQVIENNRKDDTKLNNNLNLINEKISNLKTKREVNEIYINLNIVLIIILIIAIAIISILIYSKITGISILPFNLPKISN